MTSQLALLNTALVLGGLLASAPALAGGAASSAYDASATLSTVGGGSFNVAPINQVGGMAPPAYNMSNSVASYSNRINLTAVGLPQDTLMITTGLLNASASGTYPTPPSATAASSIQNLNVLLTQNGGGVPITLISLTAQTIDSMSTATGSGATGTANLQNVTLGGTLITGSYTIPTNPTPNDVIYNSGGLEVILNEQSPIGANGISTNAVDFVFNGFPLGTSALDGNVILAHSQAEFTTTGAVPEPAVWGEMLLGFGLMGVLARRRRNAQPA